MRSFFSVKLAATEGSYASHSIVHL